MPTCNAQTHLWGWGAVAELEEKLRRHYGMRHALCVSNATTGLLAIALALELRGAEFVTTPYTYGGSLAGWLLVGNRPVFADIDPETLALDPKSVEHRISPKTRAILAVDVFGTPSDTAALRRLADEYGIWYIADAAQSLGARREGLPASGFADALVVSFTSGKTVCAGEGGAVLTNRPDLYEKLVWHTQHPRRQRRELGLHLDNEFALNGRIHPLGAAQANGAFEESLARLRERQDDCFRVIDALNDIGLTQRIRFRERGIEPSFFRLTAAWRARPKPRKLVESLASRGLRMSLDAPPIRLLHRQPAFLAQYAHLLRGRPRCPVAERQARLRFSLVRNSG